jgi:cell division protein FtsB
VNPPRERPGRKGSRGFTDIEAEKVSVWNPSQPSVLRALWINNSSDLILDGGSFNVLEADAFAGEGLMDPIKPGEKRLLSYAADLGLLVDEKQKSEKQKITKIVIAHGVMTETTEEREEHIYTIRNRDTSARTVVIEHPARQGWRLADGTEPAESTASFHHFRLNADPKKTTIVSVKERRPISIRYQLTNVTDGQVDFFVSQNAINREVERVLRRVLEKKNAIAAFEADIAARKAQMSGIAEDQLRVRENMKALKGGSEEKALVERYARELNDQEDRVQFLQREISGLREKRDVTQKALTEMIENLELEATL